MNFKIEQTVLPEIGIIKKVIASLIAFKFQITLNLFGFMSSGLYPIVISLKRVAYNVIIIWLSNNKFR